MDTVVSKRIAIAKFIMIVGVIVLHVPPYVPLEDTGSTFFDTVKCFFSHGLFRVTVPLLTCISAFLLFESKIYLNYKLLLIKKIKTILIPFLIWNFPLVIVLFCIQKFGLSFHEFDKVIYPFDFLNFLDASIGMRSTPVNYPLNFLRDLFVLTIFSPFFGILLSKIPIIGFFLIFFIFIFNVDGYLILRDSMMVNFYIGGLLSIKKVDLKIFDKYSFLLMLTLICLCLYVGIFHKTVIYSFIFTPILAWYSISLIEKTKFAEFIYSIAPMGFFIFLAHGPILLFLWIVYKLNYIQVEYYYFWIFSPIFTLLILVLLYSYLKKTFPNFLSLVLGGRV